jgi:hypothetical protein
VARDVVDTATLRGSAGGKELAARTREIAEVADLELRGERSHEARARAERSLASTQARTEDALVVRAQLRQMLADIRAAD